MKQSDANLNSLSDVLTIAEQKALPASQQVLHYICSETDTAGFIEDNIRVVQALLHDFKDITGKDLLKNVLFICLLISCLTTQTTWNGYRGLNSGMDDDVSSLLIRSNAVDNNVTTNTGNTNNNELYNGETTINYHDTTFKKPDHSFAINKHLSKLIEPIISYGLCLDIENY